MVVLILRPAEFEDHVPAFDEPGLTQACPERSDKIRRIIRRPAAEKSNDRHCRLLRTHREWPRRYRTTEKSDELAPLHSMTSSARASSAGGMVTPSAFAVLRLMTSSNIVGCSTGMSAGLVPRSIFTTIRARWRNMS